MAEAQRYRVREATIEDHAAIAALFLEGDRHHHRGVPAVFAEPVPPVRSRELIAGQLADGFGAYLLAEHAGEVVGLARVEEQGAPELPVFVQRRYLVVDAVVVTERLRGAGVGQALMEAAHVWGRARGLTSVQLHVWEFNQDAIRFYERLGYTTLSRRMSLTLDGT
jgi:ribosomal protein S18 acetylase RimI-like enzyme